MYDIVFILLIVYKGLLIPFLGKYLNFAETKIIEVCLVGVEKVEVILGNQLDKLVLNSVFPEKLLRLSIVFSTYLRLLEGLLFCVPLVDCAHGHADRRALFLSNRKRQPLRIVHSCLPAPAAARRRPHIEQSRLR